MGLIDLSDANMSENQKEAEFSPTIAELSLQLPCSQFVTSRATVLEIERQRPTEWPRPLTPHPVFFDSSDCEGTRSPHAIARRKILKLPPSNVRRKLFKDDGERTEEPGLRRKRVFEDYLDTHLIDEEARKLTLLEKRQDRQLKTSCAKPLSAAVYSGSFDWPNQDLQTMNSTVREGISPTEDEARNLSSSKQKLDENLKVSSVKNVTATSNSGSFHWPSQDLQAMNHSCGDGSSPNFFEEGPNLSTLRRRLDERLKISSVENVPAAANTDSFDWLNEDLQAMNNIFSKGTSPSLMARDVRKRFALKEGKDKEVRASSVKCAPSAAKKLSFDWPSQGLRAMTGNSSNDSILQTENTTATTNRINENQISWDDKLHLW